MTGAYVDLEESLNLLDVHFVLNEGVAPWQASIFPAVYSTSAFVRAIFCQIAFEAVNNAVDIGVARIGQQVGGRRTAIARAAGYDDGRSFVQASLGYQIAYLGKEAGVWRHHETGFFVIPNAVVVHHVRDVCVGNISNANVFDLGRSAYVNQERLVAQALLHGTSFFGCQIFFCDSLFLCWNSCRIYFPCLRDVD